MAFPTHSALLNGTTQWLTAADSASLSPTGNQTHEGWVKIGTLPTLGNEMALWAKYDTATGQRSLSCTLSNTAGVFLFQPRSSPTGGGGTGGTPVTWSGANTGVWHFMRFVYTTAGTMDIYIDDMTTKIGTSSALDTSIFDGTAPYRLGENDFAAQTFNGNIGLWRVWSTNHTTNDTCTVYGGATANLSAEWTLDNVLTDDSGNANTLTNVGTVTFPSDVTSTCATTIVIVNNLSLLGVGS